MDFNTPARLLMSYFSLHAMQETAVIVDQWQQSYESWYLQSFAITRRNSKVIRVKTHSVDINWIDLFS